MLLAHKPKEIPEMNQKTLSMPLGGVATVASDKTLFIVWKVYQRRVEAIKEKLNAQPVYLHYHWEEKSKLHKLVSYVFKIGATYKALVTAKPRLFYIQAPPAFLLYAVWLYSKATGARYVVDAHNSIIDGSLWSRMPFVRHTMKQAATVLVHNEEMAVHALRSKLPHTVLMDRPPEVEPMNYPYPANILGDRTRPKVVIPCSYDTDEPLEEMRQATLLLPHVDFYITWYAEKLPAAYVAGFKKNTRFTGFLQQAEFDALLANADAILVLTTREGTQPSGATEALAFEKPLVVSDLGIIRRMFPKGAIYIGNTASDIAVGISKALERRDQLVEEMKEFKEEKVRLWEGQFDNLRRVTGC